MGLAKVVRKISPRAWFRFKLLRYKYYNGELEIWLIRHLSRENKLAIDVGASIGVYSRELAKSAARVVAFEANPRVAEFARQVLPPNVEIKSVALSRANGEATLRIPLNRRNNAIDDLATVEPSNALQGAVIKTESVPTGRLDEYGFQDCGLIKIDVEGHEEAVLDGGMDLIERQRPILLIEIEEAFNPGSFGRVNQRLSRLNYQACHFAGGRLQPVDPFDSRNVKLGPNFFFIPNGTFLPLLTRWERLAIEVRSRFGR